MQAELFISLYCLQEGKSLLYPTDTVWGLGCDATNKLAVSKIFDIKKRDEAKSLVVLVDGLEMLQKYIPEIPKNLQSILATFKTPTTVIYQNPQGIAENVIASDNTVAIRIVKHNFCQELISAFGKPIVSTSANLSNSKTPAAFKEIDKSILEAVDYMVNLQQDIETNSPSRIIKILSEGEVIIIRE